MHLTVVRLGQVFVKNRQWAFPQKGVGPIQGIKIGIANVVMLVVMGFAIYNFGIPTPDMRHDIRCFMIEDFKRYSDAKRNIYLGVLDEKRIRNFEFNEGRMIKKAADGLKNEDMFHSQDFYSR